MRTVRFMLSLFLVLSLFVFVECEKGDFHYTYFYFERYFAPSSVTINFGTRGCGVSLYGDNYIEGMDNPDFRKLAAEYGEMGKKRFSLIPPPFRKPYNLQGIKVWQGEGKERVDVSAKVLIDYVDNSAFINAGYKGRQDEVVRRTLSELTDHDLKWMSEIFTLYFDQLEDKSNLVLEISVRRRRPIIKRLEMTENE